MRPNNPRLVILEAEQKFGGYSFCHLGNCYLGSRTEVWGKQKSRKEGNDWGEWKHPNNPQKAILEAEQKFGGYSFCRLGRYKGRKAKKQKRKARIWENESHQITPELLFWKPNRSLGVILSVTLSAGQIYRKRNKEADKEDNDWGEWKRPLLC